MSENGVILVDRIENIILFIRGHKVILARDLAELYGVTTGNLNKAVKRNIDRFPNDFMFQLTAEEYKSLRFHFGILEKGRHSKYLPFMTPPAKPRKKIGFVVKEKKAAYGKKVGKGKEKP